MNPNSFDKEIQDAQANPDTQTQGTDTEKTVNPTPEAEQEIDYAKKFAESAKEAQRLYEENKRLKAEFEAKGTVTEETPHESTENLYPGFETLDPEAQQNLIAYTNSITKKAKEELYKDPAIAFARTRYAEDRWDRSFAEVASKFPELASKKDEFKGKYFKASNVPENITSILEDVAKIYLFDQAKAIGAEEERKKAERIDLERATSGDKTPQANRTLEDWDRMRQENPAKFAQLAKEFQNDLASGKI